MADIANEFNKPLLTKGINRRINRTAKQLTG
jgi:hypothetical protein